MRLPGPWDQMTVRRDHTKHVSATRTIHVVTSCTDRKTRTPSSEARAGSLSASSLEERIADWKDVLGAEKETLLPAGSLYSGDHWQVVRGLPSVSASGIAVRVWVCSAGYGLIELDTPVHPYAATFDALHRDAVAPREWRISGASARSVAELATVARKAGDVVLVVLSEQYLSAIRQDVELAAKILDNHLLLLSVGTQANRLRASHGGAASIADRLLPADARLKALVGGAMQSVNARLARRAIAVSETWAHDPEQLHVLFTEWGAQLPPTEPIDRVRSDDTAIREYVTVALQNTPKLTHTALLRALRASGRACEQFRFREIFRQVRDELVISTNRRISLSSTK